VRGDEPGTTLAARDDLGSATLARVSRRLIPFLLLLYILNFLDRVNVGFAALEMNRDLGFGPEVYGFGAGVFFLGYCLFEVPSNLVLYRTGARIWIARIMVTWGLAASAMMLVHTAWSFYALRFLLGVAEAGFFPGIIFYLTYWFPAPERARAYAWFLAAIPVCGVIGGPVSGALLGLDGRLGLRGWQWLFLLEGVPSIPARPAAGRRLAPIPRARMARSAPRRGAGSESGGPGGRAVRGPAARRGIPCREPPASAGRPGGVVARAELLPAHRPALWFRVMAPAAHQGQW
jgi:MFS family permease